jgi:hypothetical protein
MPTATKRKPAKRGGRPHKEGLRKPQLRVLKVLAADGGLLPRKKIIDRAKVSYGLVHKALGPVDPATCKQHDKWVGYPCLMSLGFVKVSHIADVGICFQITASGLKAYERATKDAPVGGKQPNGR